MKANDLKRIGISRDVTKGLIRQGFITPVKDSSGNYNYTEEEVKYLKRYMVLRAADIHQEQIRMIETGKISLVDALVKRKEEVSGSIEKLKEVLKLSEALIKEGISYEELLNREGYYDEYVEK